jgi:CheY-like chemotaxis protein
MTEQSRHPGNILAVDDTAVNLRLLDRLLKSEGYEVRCCSSGPEALEAAERQPPDLVLLDILMPDMDGFEVCARLKANPKLAAIPVIFLSALNATEDKVRAFRAGGVDYVSKPFQFEELLARVRTQMELRAAQLAEKELLEKTLQGAVAALWELVELTSPVLAMRSRGLRDTVRSIVRFVGIADSWQIELAATLSLLGSVALPDEVFEKGYDGREMTPDEERMFQSHPATAARLLTHIPRLEPVADMIRCQLAPDSDPSLSETARRGAHLLQLAQNLDRYMSKGADLPSALMQLQASGKFDARLLEAVEACTPLLAESTVQSLPTRKLRAGMTLLEDISSRDGKVLVLKTGTVLTETWIQRLRNFSEVRGLQENVRVSMAGPAALAES